MIFFNNDFSIQIMYTFIVETVFTNNFALFLFFLLLWLIFTLLLDWFVEAGTSPKLFILPWIGRPTADRLFYLPLQARGIGRPLPVPQFWITIGFLIKINLFSRRIYLQLIIQFLLDLLLRYLMRHMYGIIIVFWTNINLLNHTRKCAKLRILGLLSGELGITRVLNKLIINRMRIFISTLSLILHFFLNYGVYLQSFKN